MLALLLAAQVVAPNPQNPGRWFSPDDVPQFLIRQGSGAWQAPVRLDIAADGKVLACQGETDGDASELNAYTCGIIRRRGKFRPATIDGSPTRGVYRTSINYYVSDSGADIPPPPSNADVQLIVNRLPKGLRSPLLVKVAFAVDTAGEKSSCTADEAADLRTYSKHPELVPVACAQIMERYRATPASVSGQPLASVQNATVQFVVPSPAR